MIQISYLPDLRSFTDLNRFEVKAESFALAIAEFIKQTGLTEQNIFMIAKV